MNVLVIGGGGREHALCRAIAASPLLDTLFCAPGNAGIADLAACPALDPADHGAVAAFCRENAVDLAVIGPEQPLAAGLADHLASGGIRVFGPTAAAARLESSKTFTKQLCEAAGIPTAAWRCFSDPAAARACVAAHSLPVVIKADGLAAGKGVVIAQTRKEAACAVDAMLGGRFGAASAQVVIEECMTGTEASLFVLCDGGTALPLATAQDYKRAGDGDAGPNTGGMGALCPAPAMTPALTRAAMDRIITPALDAMAARDAPFTGVLYAGLMITGGGPKLVEFNVRFGDPECQAVLARLESDLLAALAAAADGDLRRITPRWSPRTALTVVMAALGYPDAWERGSVINGVADADAMPGVSVLHAGTGYNGAGQLVATGGRVLNVTALGNTIADARTRAYAAVDVIHWPGGFCRGDIGLDHGTA